MTSSGRRHDAAFVAIELVDEAGTVHPAADRAVTLTIEGPGELLGFGSANPCTSERFGDATHTTYEGRALAVVRPTAPGRIAVVAVRGRLQAFERRHRGPGALSEKHTGTAHRTGPEQAPKAEARPLTTFAGRCGKRYCTKRESDALQLSERSEPLIRAD